MNAMTYPRAGYENVVSLPVARVPPARQLQAPGPNLVFATSMPPYVLRKLGAMLTETYPLGLEGDVIAASATFGTPIPCTFHAGRYENLPGHSVPKIFHRKVQGEGALAFTVEADHIGMEMHVHVWLRPDDATWH